MGVLFFVRHAAALALILFVAAAIGTAVAGTRRSLALRSVFGLAVAGQVFVILGTAGWLNGWTIGAFIAIALIIAIRRWEPLTSPPTDHRPLLLATPLFLLALYPPLAFDETMYHLPFVRAMATSGEIGYIDHIRFGIFPLLHEALCVPVFLAFGDSATHLVALAEIILLAAILIEWRGELAAAVALGSPILVHVATITYVDAALMLFVVAAAYCIEHDEPAWAGFLLGTACSTKYLGGYFAAGAAVYLLMFNRRRLPIFIAGVAAGALPMYARILALTSNPVHPFFGTSPWAFHIRREPVWPTRLLWDITFARERTGMEPPYSPLFAITVAMTIVAAVRNARARFLVVLFVVYVCILGFLPPESRYLVPFAALFSVAAVTAIPVKRKIWAALAFAPAILYAGYRGIVLGPLPVTPAQRERFLEEHLRGYRALTHRGPGRVWSCGTEQLKYYGGDEFVGDVFGPHREMPRDTHYVLVRRGRCPFHDARFQRVYADDAAELWRLKSTP